MKKLITAIFAFTLFSLPCFADFEVNGNLTVDEKAGIGTTDPSVELEVVGNGLLTNITLTGASLLANSDASGVLTLGGVDGVSNENLTFDFETESDIVNINTSTDVTKINFSALDLVTLGNVGIGTTSPSGKLEIDGGNLVMEGTTTNKILLPLANTPATPTLAFGSGISGFYLVNDTNLRVALNGGHEWTFSTTGFMSQGQHATIRNVDATATVPNLHTDNEDLTAGIGGLRGTVALITGGVSGLTVDASQNVGIGTTGPAAKLDVVGTTRLGDSATNYAMVDADGDLSFVGTARIDWTKITANSITLDVGTTGANPLSNLQTHDGVTTDIDEIGGVAPAILFTVDFVSVTAFNWVQVIAEYNGGTNHAVCIELWDWNASGWVVFDSEDGIETGLTDHSFFVPSDTNYVGTVGDAGKVRVRFNHLANGNGAHNFFIDVVALYQ